MCRGKPIGQDANVIGERINEEGSVPVTIMFSDGVDTRHLCFVGVGRVLCDFDARPASSVHDVNPAVGKPKVGTFSGCNYPVMQPWLVVLWASQSDSTSPG